MKALFVPFAPSLAHVSRCLAVAEAWRAKGHTALFAVGAERDALVRSAGFDTRPVPEVAGEVFRTAGLEWMSREYFADNLAAEKSVLAEVAPDVVVSDFRFTTPLSARLAGRPSAGILHGSALCFASLPVRETARLLFGDIRQVHGFTALRARLLRRGFPIVFGLVQKRIVRRWAPLLEENGCPSPLSPYSLLLGEATLAADVPELLPSTLPPNTHVVGPLRWSGWEAPAPWLDELDDRPLIYVTVGSTVEAQPILMKIVDALRDEPCNVVVSSAGLSLPGDLKLPSHVRLFPTVPGATVLARSKLVIHLGGHGTLMQAMSAGVPSLLLPVNPDQILIAQKAHALGVGLNLWQPGGLPVDASWQRRLTLPMLRSAVHKLMSEPSFWATCQEFKQRLAQTDCAAVAAEILEGIAATGSVG
jgi:UDP:flavonoid glycosyltransferase YjiC (YdhE family)